MHQASSLLCGRPDLFLLLLLSSWACSDPVSATQELLPFGFREPFITRPLGHANLSECSLKQNLNYVNMDLKVHKT